MKTIKSNIAKAFLGLAVVASPAFFSSCNDMLDLAPQGTFTDAQLDSTSIEGLLTSAYAGLECHFFGNNESFQGPITNWIFDVRSDDAYKGGQSLSMESNIHDLEVSNLRSDNVCVRDKWRNNFYAIDRVHKAMRAIKDADVEGKESMLAELKTLRAYFYFDLIRVFAMPYSYDNGQSLGVPIVTTATGPDSKPERNTVAECYDQIIADLTNSLAGLSKEKKDGCLNYWAVQGILSRVYLNKLDYPNAYKAATDVIENSKSLYQLYTLDEYPTVWGKEYTSESLFEFYFSLTEPSGGSGGEGAPMVYANEEKVDWNNLILSEDYLNLLDEDPQDVRHSVMQVSAIANNTDLPEAARNRTVYLAKFPGKTGDPRDNNLCIVRLSEIYLNAAEAGLKIGGEQATKGMEYLNDVITNRTTNTAMKVNAAADFTLERILKERRKELVGEGLAVYDYTRNKLPVERKGSWHLTSLETSNAYTIQPNDSRLAIPIPQTEIDANPNLVQNP